MFKKIFLIIFILIVGTGFYLWRTFTENNVPADGPIEIVSNNNQEEENLPDMEVVARNLTIPWDLVFLPSGDLLITERDGRLIKLQKNGETKEIQIEGVSHKGEGGLLGLVLHPDFSRNNYLYIYLSTSSGNGTINRVERYKFDGEELSDKQVIIDKIPGAIFHDGGRMIFGPDNFLYITTGDATNPEIAQDLNSLGGKILRIKDDGSVPEDNPFGTAIYSYGHRNPQGITWDNSGNLWSTEHGRSGVRSGLDELNLIERGGNYGWPESEGDTVLPGTIAPALHSGASVTWAPASALYWDGSIFFGGLRGETLYEAVLNGKNVVELREHFVKEFGRIRTIVLGPDGMFYITTSNRDGRGNIREGDDKIIRLNPRQFRD